MAVNTFDDFCELEARENRSRRAGIFSNYGDDEYKSFEWIDDEETRDYDAVEDIVREPGELEEIF